MQTILGAGGAIGIELAKALPQYTDKIRLVSRHPKSSNDSDELFPADLSIASQVEKAVAGSDVVYLVAGFQYNIKVWEKTWPLVMNNVIDACKKHHSKLVFFDNVYMYDRDYINHMTEETRVRPTSKKGQIRMELVRMLMEEVRHGNLKALIARSADFYSLTNSVLVEMVYKNLKKGKKANWFVDVDKVHSFTYAKDAAIATAILGNTPDAYDQVWHLPTDPTKLTGKDWIELFAKNMGVEPEYTVVPAWMVGMLGIVMPIMKEFREMLYQYDRDYFFDSSKFDRRFKFTPTAPEAGIRALLQQLRQQ